ncbi:MAG: TIM barrel protein [Candidatus ainarchaeum sp.]|nr:TIM barrel protein [Candidatus ainarchaeum sp.]
MAKVRFGPAGLPVFPFEGGTPEAMAYLRDEGLDAMEVEFVRGVKMRADTAGRAGSEAERNGISLSCHAPYWINCAAKEPAKLKNTVRNLMETARAADALGAKVVVFHPAYYLGRPGGEVMEITLRTLREVEERMAQEGIRGVVLGPETGGKTTQLGGLEETIELASALSRAQPVVDFAHLHARGNGWIKGKAQYAEIFEKLEKGLGRKAVESFHSHFSEIEFGEYGERNHAALGSLPKHSPDFRPLAEVLVENGYSGTVVCETPMLDMDSRKMRRIYEEAGKRA